MGAALDYLRTYSRRQHVRPWALAAPILVLLITLPILRPLRHPDPQNIGPQERGIVATVQALAERHTLAIDSSALLPREATVQIQGRTYANQPPVMAFLLSGAYWIMRRCDLPLDEKSTTAIYLLTVLGSTLPLAAVAGLIYRMGRLFELYRPWRVALSLSVVLATGLLPYGVFLNPYAPAAALVLASAGALIHIGRVAHPRRRRVWITTAGLCAALAATLDPGAVAFLVLFLAVVIVMRWTIHLRRGVLLYLIGAAVPIALHMALTAPILGQFRLPTLDGRLLAATASAPTYVSFDSEDAAPPAVAGRVGDAATALLDMVVGRIGLLSHFPVLLMGVVGIGVLVRRHWPLHIKILATATMGAIAIILVLRAFSRADASALTFANPYLVVASPLLLYWSGAWLRRRHHPVTWAVVGTLLGVSIVISILGAANPCPPGGFTGYSAIEAMRH